MRSRSGMDPRGKAFRLGLCLALTLGIFYGRPAGAAMAVTAADFVPPGTSKPPVITADAAVLMEAHTGALLYSRNGLKPRSPASLTKIMTAVVAIESGRMAEVVEVPAWATWVEGSAAGLAPGERYTLEELVYALMLPSGNDAALAIAAYLGGGVGGFASLMNQKARAIGALHTHFKNPHGLTEIGHLTTAYDLAQIARYAMENPTFARIVSTARTVIYPKPAPGQTTRSGQRGLELVNTNKLLWSYAPAEGIKTGTTAAAGKCLVACAAKGRMRLIAVLLRSDDRWEDAMRLLDFGFDSFALSQRVEARAPWRTIPVRGGAASSVTLRTQGELSAVLAIRDAGPKQGGATAAGSGVHSSMASAEGMGQRDDLGGEAEGWRTDLPAYNIPLAVADPRKIQVNEVLPLWVRAPVARGQPLGELQLWAEGRVIGRTLLVADKSVPRFGFARYGAALVRRVAPILDIR